MSLDIAQLRKYIIKPSLDAIGLWSVSAEQLVAGTGLVESGYSYMHQMGAGPAISFFGIEPLTYGDLQRVLVTRHQDIHDLICKFLSMSDIPTNSGYLAGNLYAATIFCRLKYYFNPKPLPQADDYYGMAKYHKEIYNTANGATDIDKSTGMFRSIVKGYTYHY